jgi:hypothetical protein
MDFSTWLHWLGSISLDDLMVWGVGGAAGVLALIALVNALDLFFDAEAG